MGYRFSCRYCGSKFSLEQQKDGHEVECGKAGGTGKASPKTPPKGIPCKRCQAAGIDARFANIGELIGHVRAEHLEDFQAKHSAGIRRQRAEKKKTDTTVRGSGHGAGAAPSAKMKRPGPQPVHAPGNGHTCPTCGGPLPEATAQLVKELAAAGIPEVQAFEAARIARRILGAGAAIQGGVSRSETGKDRSPRRAGDRRPTQGRTPKPAGGQT